MDYKYIRCRRCNRLLRTPEAKMRGYGAYCWLMSREHSTTKKYRQNSLFNIIEDKRI